MEGKKEEERRKETLTLGMGWSDLASDLVISIASRLPEPDDYARFRSVCRSWESASRGFRPLFFPWLTLIPDYPDDDRNEEVNRELSFISHVASNGDLYKHRPMPSGHISPDEAKVSCKDGWILFVLDDYFPIIVNPLTGARLQDLPSLDPFLDSQRRQNPGKSYDFVLFLSGNLVAFAECYVCRSDGSYHVLATASQGDDGWSFVRLSSSYIESRISGIVFHEADRKFYAMDTKGEMRSFRLFGCGRKTVFREVSMLAEPTGQKSVASNLVSYGTDLLQVRVKNMFKEFDILKYCPDEDMWVKTMNFDLGNNALFIDYYRAMLLPLPQGDGYLEKKEGRPRRNCIYFTKFEEIPIPFPTTPQEEEEEEEEEEEDHRCVYHVRVYDVGKGTVEHCFSTTIPSNYCAMPPMWFTPSLSVNN